MSISSWRELCRSDRRDRINNKRIASVPVHLPTDEIGYQFDERLGFSLNARWQPQDTYIDHYNGGLK